MFVTNASIRRYLMLQKQTQPDAPPKLWDRYHTYVWCVARDEQPKTFNEWLED